MGATTTSLRQQRDVIEELVVELRKKRELILRLTPCRIVAHLPPPDSGEQQSVVLEVNAKLK